MSVDPATIADLEHDTLEDVRVNPKAVKRAPNKAILEPKETKYPWGDDWLHSENPAIWKGEH